MRLWLIQRLVASNWTSPPMKKKLISKIAGDPFTADNHDEELIFIHIPKNAGGSIKKALFGKVSGGHQPLVCYEAFDASYYGRYRKVACVRNPWDRLHSAFSFLRQGGKHKTDKKWAKKHLNHYSSFREFVLDLCNTRRLKQIRTQAHFWDQHYWLRNSTYEIGADIVLRYENLNESLEMLGRRLGRKIRLSTHRHQSHRQPYTEVYDDEMIEIVRNIYHTDIRLFDYSFNNA